MQYCGSRTVVMAMVCVRLGLLWAVLPAVSAAAEMAEKTIQGTIMVHPDFARYIAPADRLIIKLFYPGDNLEKDQKFTILSKFTLPLEFRVSPTLDMSGASKWPAYVVEVFTDKDQDIVSIVPGELIARTPEPIPLGTTGVVLELHTLRK
jgi:hypothetical protein